MHLRWGFWFCFLIVGYAPALETDQFTDRDIPITDALPILNQRVNDVLADIAANWQGGEHEWRFCTAVWTRLGGVHWIDRLERYAMDAPEIEKLPTPRYHSIYAGIPWWATRVAYFYGIGKTIKLNGVLIGTDKIGHFFSQGRKFYRRYRRTGSVSKAARRSAATESGIFGQKTTGSFSNADVVANYEGFRFYRSLFHSDVTPNKGPILTWRDGKPVVLRAFDFADYVNSFWDEALNPNRYDHLLAPHMKRRLADLCPKYHQNRALYDSPAFEDLWARYAKTLRLRDAREFLMVNICRHEPASAAATGAPRTICRYRSGNRSTCR